MTGVTSNGSRARRLGSEVEAEAERFESSSVFRWLVRLGFAARAVTYGVIGGLAFALAVGAGTDGVAPNQQGALTLIARSVVGRLALGVIAAGLLAYALWKLSQGVFGHGPEGGGSPKAFDRVSNLGAGIVYVGFFLVALRSLTGSSGNSSSEPKHAAAGVLGWPGGAVLVAVAGVALIAISAYQVYDAVSGHFEREAKTRRMSDAEQRAFLVVGRVGITARALAFALVGYFLLETAVAYDPRKAVGLDGALAQLHQQPLGPELVGLFAAGLLVFALYSVLEGRNRRL